MNKQQALEEFVRNVWANIDRKQISGSEPIRLNSVPYTNRKAEMICSYLLGIAGFYPCLDGRRMRNALSADDFILLRQLVPWKIPFGQSPECYLDDKLVWFAVPWPLEEQRNVKLALDDCAQSVTMAKGSRKIILGADTKGSIVTPEFSPELTEPHHVTHIMIAGKSGYGKSSQTRLIVVQVARQEQTQSVLIDGGGGKSLGYVNGVPGQVGPLATSLPRARDALFWAYKQVEERNYKLGTAMRGGHDLHFPPIMVYISEFDRFTSDGAFSTMFNDVVRRGRSASVHVVAESQSTKADDLGDISTRQQMDRIVFRTADRYASEAALPTGCKLKPHKSLTAPGDGLFVTGRGRLVRFLAAYLEPEQYEAYTTEPPSEPYPEFDASEVAGVDDGRRSEKREFSVEQLAVGATAHRYGWSRDDTRKALHDVTGNGMSSRKIDNDLAEAGERLDNALAALNYCRAA
jgi:hypothetical protein